MTRWERKNEGEMNDLKALYIRGRISEALLELGDTRQAMDQDHLLEVAKQALSLPVTN